jgi:hypothetical protein
MLDNAITGYVLVDSISRQDLTACAMFPYVFPLTPRLQKQFLKAYRRVEYGSSGTNVLSRYSHIEQSNMVKSTSYRLQNYGFHLIEIVARVLQLRFLPGLPYSRPKKTPQNKISVFTVHYCAAIIFFIFFQCLLTQLYKEHFKDSVRYTKLQFEGYSAHPHFHQLARPHMSQ